jgi:tetratricopeptide (TPR) repeat protein
MSRWRILSFWLAPVLLTAAVVQQPPTAKPSPPEQTQPLPPDEDAPPPAAAAKPPAPKTQQNAQPSDADLPPDEDAALTAGEKHSFNPVESKKSVQAGEFYFKKGNYGAAADRFRDATQWNEGNADAWLSLGEAEEKRNRGQAARDAYEKYLQLAGNSKNAEKIKKKLEKLK